MDTMRGAFSGQDSPYGEPLDFDHSEDEPVRELPPAAIGQDERRMQVRAYNFWAGLLEDRNFPSVEDLEPESLPDFGPYSVLLDFSAGIDNPAIQFLGNELAGECGAEGPIKHLNDVPSRSLLSRITDHYLQIIANQAPIGFEAEFVNQRGATILYRGILLPFSSDDDTIDFIYGVINWKELADQQTTDELLLEIDQALETPGTPREEAALPEWADGPMDDPAVVDLAASAEPALPADEDDWPEPSFAEDEPLELGAFAELEAPVPGFTLADGAEDLELTGEMELAGSDETAMDANTDWEDETEPALELMPDMALDEALPAPDQFAAEDDTDWPVTPLLPDEMELADWLASARELAQVARSSEDRSHQALYAAIGRAHDFRVAAADAPEELAELIADAGLTAQDRAPLTPVVKLIFGADYDKTRIAEYAAVLGHAERNQIAQGALADYLAKAPGGLKGLVAEERRLRRGEDGKVAQARQTPRPGILRKLRALEHSPIADVPAEGEEFALLIARRLPTGEVVLLGEVIGDAPLFEKAAKKLLG